MEGPVHLRELELGQADGRHTNRRHKHFPTLLESIDQRFLNDVN